MFSSFFINRPIFASVLSIVITMAGGIAVFTLPITQYPDITPPTVEVSASYPGANSQVVADTVAAPIEQQVNGVENMMYMYSQATNDGNYTLTITFKVGTDLNIAQVLVQNRVTLATPILPDLVKRKGILVKKKSPSVLMIVNLFSPNESREDLYLSNYATIQIRDELARLPGIGDITYLGQRDYSMRLWLDPGRMAARNLTASDVVNAINQQNVQVAAGQIGQPPVPSGQVFQFTMTTLGRLADPEQFGAMILKADAEGRLVRMRDVVRESLYRVRLRLDPDKLAKHGLRPADVKAALAARGRVPQEEEPETAWANGAAREVPIYLATFRGPPPPTRQRVAGLAELLVGPPGKQVRLGDLVVQGGIRRAPERDELGVELGAQSYDQSCTLDGKPSVALSVYQLPGSNALETARLVRQKMDEMKGRFPAGLDYKIVYDTTPFITESIVEVFNTLRDAVLLVAFVVLLFLQNWRSAVIPLVAVPVAIVGTFAVMAAFGFSLNNLTLFGLVLAIGIVVDDAIVVVEAVEHHIEHGMTPPDATARAMSEVSGPVVAVGLVLTAVFVPCAFIAGITGQFFRQFALTIAVSTVISAFNSLTLSPALCAILLKPRTRGVTYPEVLPRHVIAAIAGLLAVLIGMPYLAPWLEPVRALFPEGFPEWLSHLLLGLVVIFPWAYAAGLLASRTVNRVLAYSFRLFNQGFEKATAGYTRAVARSLRLSGVVLLVYGGLLFLTYWGFTHVPTGFIPQQDKGYLLVNVQLPDAASVERTQRVMRTIEGIAKQTDGVAHTVAISGQSLLLNANSPNFGAMYVMLDDFHERTGRGLTGEAIAARLQDRLQQKIPEALINVFEAPPVEGLGTAGGFKVVTEDRGDNGPMALQALAERLAKRGNDTGKLQGLYTSFRANTPWLFLDIDRAEAKTKGVSLAEVFNTLQVQLGSLYVNDFNQFGRTWQVNVQAAARFRTQFEDIKQLKLRNESGNMVPLGTLLSPRWVNGPVMVARYNMYPAAAINGSGAPGVSSGEAIDAMAAVVQQEIPPSMRYEWTELALLQLQTGNTAMYVFVLAVVLVFLVLAAQYESWSLPLAVILVVPMCLLCSIVGVVLARMDINIFTQIGFVVLVGLACKNAILIVEFAKARREAGVPRFEATLEACKLRLRPIMMTSFAFILGVVPLVLSQGAGAEMRRTLGTAVFAGMLGVTLFGIFLTPVFYYVIQWFGDWRERRRERETASPVPSDDGG